MIELEKRAALTVPEVIDAHGIVYGCCRAAAMKASKLAKSPCQYCPQHDLPTRCKNHPEWNCCIENVIYNRQENARTPKVCEECEGRCAIIDALRDLL